MDRSRSAHEWRWAFPPRSEACIATCGRTPSRSDGDLAATALEASTAAHEKGGHDRTLPRGNSPILTGVSSAKGGHDRTVPDQNCPVLTGVSSVKGGQDQTPFDLGPPETPAKTPAETPAKAPTRAREENPRTPEPRKTPPAPLKGGAPLAR